MATIIDAFVVEFGLDPTKFSEGQKKLLDEVKKTKEGIQKHGKDIDETTKNIVVGFEKISKVLGEVTLGYLTASGISSFIQSTNAANVAIGQFATVLGVMPEKLALYQRAARMANVDPASMTATLNSLNSGMAAATRGENPGMFRAAALLGGDTVSQIYSNDPFALLRSAATSARQAISSGRLTQAQVNNELAKMGFSAETIYMIDRTDGALEKFLGIVGKMNFEINKQVSSSTDLTSQWSHLAVVADNLGNIISRDMNGPLSYLVKGIEAATEKSEKFVEVLEILGGLLSGTILGSVIGGILGFAVGGPVGAAVGAGVGGRIGAGVGVVSGALTADQHAANVAADADAKKGGSNASTTGGSSSAINGPMPSGRSDVARHVAQQLRDAGVPESGVAALLANIQRESGFNASSRVADQPHFFGEAHYAHGLYQEGGTEWNKYASWLSKNYPGRAWQDPRLQTEFLMQNLKKNYPGVWSSLNNPSLSAGQKAMLFQHGYLRPAVPHTGDMGTAERYLRNPPAPLHSGTTDTPNVAPTESWQHWLGRHVPDFWRGSSNQSTVNKQSSLSIGNMNFHGVRDMNDVAQNIDPFIRQRFTAVAADNGYG